MRRRRLVWRISAMLLTVFVVLLSDSLTEAQTRTRPIDDPYQQLTVQQYENLKRLIVNNYLDNHVAIVVWLPIFHNRPDYYALAKEYFDKHAISQGGNGYLLMVDFPNHVIRQIPGSDLAVYFDPEMNRTSSLMLPFFIEGDLANGLAVGLTHLMKVSAKWDDNRRPPLLDLEGFVPAWKLWLITLVITAILLSLLTAFLAFKRDAFIRRRDRERQKRPTVITLPEPPPLPSVFRNLDDDEKP